MKKRMVLGAIIASAGMFTTMQGCSAGEVIGNTKTLWDWRNEEIEKAKKSGLPGQQLDAMMEDVQEWVAENAPNLPGVAESEYMKIFVIGGTINNSNLSEEDRSVSDAEVDARTRQLFSELRVSDSMKNSFVFMDRSSDYKVDISEVTGDVRNNPSDVLGESVGMGGDTYLPEDIYLLKLAFDEIQDLDERPSTMKFNLTATIEWGGSIGEPVENEVFKTRLVFNKEAFGGSWEVAE